MNASDKPAEPRLTSLSHGGGCGCKIAPGVLSEILKGTAAMPIPKELLVGIETADDAAVYQLNDEQALIATTDFFMPIVELAFFQRGGHHAHAHGLAQHQHVAGSGIGIALDMPGVHEAQRDQAVDGLHGIDGVPARDRNAGGTADRCPAFEDAADRLRGQHRDRHGHQRQRHDRPAAHRVDVADRVGGGDAAEVERVVDDGHEKVGGRDQGLLVVEKVHGGVVAGFDADQQLGRDRHRGSALEDVAQHAGRDLAAAAAAVGEGGQARFGVG